MEVTVGQEQLQKSLELVGRVSAKNPTLPILQCVRLRTKEGRMVIEATNLEINVAIDLEVKVTEEGEVAVPAQVFLQSIQQIGQPEIVLRVEEQTLQMETSHSTTSIKVFATDEFPTINKLEKNKLITNGAMFALGIKSVAFAASNTSIKPELGSVYVQQKKEHSLTFVATDSFRLMEKTVPQKGLVIDSSFMIPAKNALELARVCDVVGEDPELLLDENQCALQFATGVYISSRLVNGSFPDYQQIIPKEFVSYATVLKDDLQKTLKKTSIFLNKFRQVSLALTTKNVTITSQNNDVGHITDTIKSEVEGDELILSFNQQYLVEPLSSIQDDSLKLSFAGIGRAVIIEGVTDKSCRYLVMPMNK